LKEEHQEEEEEEEDTRTSMCLLVMRISIPSRMSINDLQQANC